jgi:PPOX class probable F420-dependent enzyme
MPDNPLPDAATPFGERVRSRLTADRVIWLTTIGKDGTPQPNPVWFLWDGGTDLLLYNRPDANRLAHVVHRPRVALNFDGNGQGGDIVVLTGTAHRDQDAVPPDENVEYLAKYEQAARRIGGGDLAAFAKAYPVALRVRIERVRGF